MVQCSSVCTVYCTTSAQYICNPFLSRSIDYDLWYLYFTLGKCYEKLITSSAYWDARDAHRRITLLRDACCFYKQVLMIHYPNHILSLLAYVLYVSLLYIQYCTYTYEWLASLVHEYPGHHLSEGQK